MTSEVTYNPPYAKVSAPPGQIAEWTEEVRYWKQEAHAFLRLAAISKLACRSSELTTLEKVTAELGHLVHSAFPDLEKELDQLNQLPDGSVETVDMDGKIHANRRTYRKLKARLLPFLTLLIKAGIW